MGLKEARKASVHWFETKEADANITEILFFAFLVVANADNVAELNVWAKKVADDYNRATELKLAWKPLSTWPVVNKSSTLFQPMHDAYNNPRVPWSDDKLDEIGVAMQYWRGDGQFDNLRKTQLRNHLSRPPPGIRLSKKTSLKDAPPRWKSWQIVKVAALISSSGVEMRKLLKLDIEPEEAVPLQQRLDEAMDFCSYVAGELEEKEAELRRAKDAHYQVAKRLKTKAKAVTTARAEERRAAAEKRKREVDTQVEAALKRREQKAATAAKTAQAKLAAEEKRLAAALKEAETKRACAEEDVREEVQRHKKGLNVARERARVAEREKESAERKVGADVNGTREPPSACCCCALALSLSGSLLTCSAFLCSPPCTLQLRRWKVEAAKEQEAADGDDEMGVSEEEQEEERPSSPSNLPFDLVPRRDEKGRWQAEAPEVRALHWAQLARGVAPMTVDANMQDAIALLTPGVVIPAAGKTKAHQLRGEVTLAGEAMAAWKFAIAVRIMCFGWDESTKFGDSVFGCNFQVQYADGTIEDICLRGLSILPEGGTSAAVLEHIEKRILSYSRRILTEFMKQYEKMNGGEGSWAAAGGPSPENIGLHRLCEDTVRSRCRCSAACFQPLTLTTRPSSPSQKIQY